MIDITNLIDEVIEQETRQVIWPEKFFNRKTRQFFKPQNDEIQEIIFETDDPPYVYIMSGEGAGKTASLAVLTLNKLRRGMSGAFVCVDLPMLIKVWDEFKQWIPKEVVIPEHQHYLTEHWSPYRSVFEIVFYSETGDHSKLIIGGLGDEYGKWESLNLNFFVLDETRHIPDEKIMKIATGRIRIKGPNGEPPQLVVGSTPTEDDHWMFDWFGPELPEDEDDPYREFKRMSKVIKLSVEANRHNLSDAYLKNRGVGLNENEKKIFVDGEWGSSSSDDRFVENIEIWRRLYDSTLTPPKTKQDRDRNWSDVLVVGMDGAIKDDSFALVAVSRNPKSRQDIAVRLIKEFKPVNGRIDFVGVENTLRFWCNTYNVVTVVYDIYQVYDLAERLRKDGISWFQEFSQGNKRSLADNFLYELILQNRIAHMGQPELETHIKNAGTKYDVLQKKRRIVKIRQSRKIDLVVALAMAAWECNRLDIH